MNITTLCTTGVRLLAGATIAILIVAIQPVAGIGGLSPAYAASDDAGQRADDLAEIEAMRDHRLAAARADHARDVAKVEADYQQALADGADPEAAEAEYNTRVATLNAELAAKTKKIEDRFAFIKSKVEKDWAADEGDTTVEAEAETDEEADKEREIGDDKLTRLEVDRDRGLDRAEDRHARELERARNKYDRAIADGEDPAAAEAAYRERIEALKVELAEEREKIEARYEKKRAKLEERAAKEAEKAGEAKASKQDSPESETLEGTGKSFDFEVELAKLEAERDVRLERIEKQRDRDAEKARRDYEKALSKGEDATAAQSAYWEKLARIEAKFAKRRAEIETEFAERKADLAEKL